MPLVSKGTIYRNRKQIEALLKKHSVENCYVFGMQVDPTATYGKADLSLLVEPNKNLTMSQEDWKAVPKKQLESELKNLLQCNSVEIYTQEELENRISFNIGRTQILDPPKTTNQILKHKQSLAVIINMGQEQSEMADNIQQELKKVDLSFLENEQPPSKLTPEQQNFLINLGVRYNKIVGIPPYSYVGDNAYSSLDEKSQKVIDYSKNWNPHYAAANGQYDIMQILLQHNIDPNDIDDIDELSGTTLLTKAAFGNHEKIVTLLLEAGAFALKQGREGKTPKQHIEGQGGTNITTLLENQEKKERLRLDPALAKSVHEEEQSNRAHYLNLLSQYISWTLDGQIEKKEQFERENPELCGHFENFVSQEIKKLSLSSSKQMDALSKLDYSKTPLI